MLAFTLILPHFSSPSSQQSAVGARAWQFVQFITNFVIELVIMVVKRIGVLLRRRTARC